MSWNEAEPRRLTEARLLIASPERVYKELQAYGEFIIKRSRIYGNEDLERTLLERHDRLINLGLAQFGCSAEIISAIYKLCCIPTKPRQVASSPYILEIESADSVKARCDDDKYNLGVRVACLSNSSIRDGVKIDFGSLIAKGDSPETDALLGNPSVSSELLASLYERSGIFANLDDRNWLRMVMASAENPRLDTDNTSSYGPDLGFWKIHRAIFTLLETAPLTRDAIFIIHGLLSYFAPHHANATCPDEIAPVLARWQGAETRKNYKGEEEDGYHTHLQLKQEFRCLIASLYGKRLSHETPRKRIVMGAPSDEDVAFRCAYYGNAEMMTIAEMQAAYARDGGTFLFAALNNSLLYHNDSARRFLEERVGEDLRRIYKKRCEQIHKHMEAFDPNPVGDNVINDEPLQKSSEIILLEQATAQTQKIAMQLEQLEYRFSVAYRLAIATVLLLCAFYYFH